MIIVRAPNRVSLSGGGTDFPEYFNSFGPGLVLGGAINCYNYLSVRKLPPFFEYKTRLAYSKTEYLQENHLAEHEGFRGAFQLTGITDGLELVHQSDLPRQCGLGSSSSFMVSLLHALQAYRGEPNPNWCLDEHAYYVERNILRHKVGQQDQKFAAFGGLKLLEFNGLQAKSTKIDLSPGEMEQLEASLLLCWTGVTRTSSDIAGSYQDYGKLHPLVDMTKRSLDNLLKPDQLGLLVDVAWRLKKGLSPKVSTPAFDLIYQQAMSAGAFGGKLTGAGGGGCFLFVVDPDRRKRVREAVGLPEIPFKFTSEGSTVVYDDGERL